MVNFMELVEKTLSFSFGHYFSKVMFLHPLYGSINEQDVFPSCTFSDSQKPLQCPSANSIDPIPDSKHFANSYPHMLMH